MNLFLKYSGGRGPTRWGLRTEGPKVEDQGKGRRLRVDDHKHLLAEILCALFTLMLSFASD